MSKQLTPNERAFIIGLTALSKETGIEISGCGCCDSPFIYEFGDDGEEAEHDELDGYALLDGQVQWVAKSDAREWRLHGGKVLRTETDEKEATT